jgi:DNA ligase (NAD+)
VRKWLDEVAHYCINPHCDAKKIENLIHFVSRDAMNIEGLSEATLEKFIINGYVKDFTDIVSKFSLFAHFIILLFFPEKFIDI